MQIGGFAFSRLHVVATLLVAVSGMRVPDGAASLTGLCGNFLRAPPPVSVLGDGVDERLSERLEVVATTGDDAGVRGEFAVVGDFGVRQVDRLEQRRSLAVTSLSATLLVRRR